MAPTTIQARKPMVTLILSFCWRTKPPSAPGRLCGQGRGQAGSRRKMPTAQMTTELDDGPADEGHDRGDIEHHAAGS